jgi:hypothetical protein
VVIDVRADERIEPEDAEVLAVTEAACAEVGWEFRGLTSIGTKVAPSKLPGGAWRDFSFECVSVHRRRRSATSELLALSAGA